MSPNLGEFVILAVEYEVEQFDVRMAAMMNPDAARMALRRRYKA